MKFLESKNLADFAKRIYGNIVKLADKDGVKYFGSTIILTSDKKAHMIFKGFFYGNKKSLKEMCSLFEEVSTEVSHIGHLLSYEIDTTDFREPGTYMNAFYVSMILSDVAKSSAIALGKDIDKHIVFSHLREKWVHDLWETGDFLECERAFECKKECNIEFGLRNKNVGYSVPQSKHSLLGGVR